MKSLIYLLLTAACVQLIAAQNWYSRWDYGDRDKCSCTASYTCPCCCDLKWEPVCGTNGRTYSNRCLLDCSSCWNSREGFKEIDWWKDGACPKLYYHCPLPVDPVCGSNGKSYPSICHLNRHSEYLINNQLEGITLAHYGVCKRANCLECAVTVCGSNCVNYNSICHLEYADILNLNKGGKGITMLYPSKCKKNCIPA